MSWATPSEGPQIETCLTAPYLRTVNSYAPTWDGVPVVSDPETSQFVLASPELFSSAYGTTPDSDGSMGGLIETDAPVHTLVRALLRTPYKPARIQVAIKHTVSISSQDLDGIYTVDLVAFTRKQVIRASLKTLQGHDDNWEEVVPLVNLVLEDSKFEASHAWHVLGSTLDLSELELPDEIDEVLNEGLANASVGLLLGGVEQIGLMVPLLLGALSAAENGGNTDFLSSTRNRQAIEHWYHKLTPIYWVMRTPTSDTKLANLSLRGGEKFYVQLGGDQAQLGFGHGPHVCIAKQLAIHLTLALTNQLWDDDWRVDGRVWEAAQIYRTGSAQIVDQLTAERHRTNGRIGK